MAATKFGGGLMGMGEEVGQIRPGFFADLLLQDKANLAAIIKDERFQTIGDASEGDRWRVYAFVRNFENGDKPAWAGVAPNSVDRILSSLRRMEVRFQTKV